MPTLQIVGNHAQDNLGSVMREQWGDIERLNRYENTLKTTHYATKPWTQFSWSIVFLLNFVTVQILYETAYNRIITKLLDMCRIVQ